MFYFNPHTRFNAIRSAVIETQNAFFKILSHSLQLGLCRAAIHKLSNLVFSVITG